MKDICYKCGVVQEYGTMKDINEFSFEILCYSCYNKTTINWNDNTSTTQSPTGEIITYKNK